MVASLGHGFRRKARGGHVAAFVVTSNLDGSFSVVQSRVVTASGLVSATIGIIVARMIGLIGMVSSLKGAKTTVDAVRARDRHVGSGAEKLREFLPQAGAHGALTVIRCPDQEAEAVVARAADRASHYWRGSRSEFLAALDQLGSGYEWARPAAGDPPGAHEARRDRRSARARNGLATRMEHGDTYVLVFFLLIVTYFLVSLLPEATWSQLLEELAAGATLLIALRTSHAHLRLQRIARSAVVAGFVLTVVGSLIGGTTLALVALVFMVLLLVAPFVILNRILRHRTVTVETIAGAIDVYVLLGLIFSALYRSIAAISGTSFFVETHHPSANQYLYFSFVTLTTTGYGDLTAATSFGRSVVVLEPLLGQIFLVTTVARLVSIWQPGRRRNGHPPGPSRS